MCDRYEAEDIANGTPISGSDKLVDRIESGLDEAYDRGYEDGVVTGTEEAFVNLAAHLDLDGTPPAETDKALAWFVKALSENEKEHALVQIAAQNEAYNEGLDDLSEALGTKQAFRKAHSMYRSERTGKV
jgi:hypothetical protein